MEAVLAFITDYHVADLMIGGMGLFGIVLLVDRFKALYLDYTFPVEAFMNQVMALVSDGKIDEAITYCAANKSKPLAYVIKRILERSDRDERAIDKSLDIAAAEVAPQLIKNLNHLPMVSNVVTLIGLFGTVIGLIVAFKAISYADPSQKQTVLAQGISTAMTATAMGLMVAIPVMFIYSFLYTKQAKLFSEIDQHAARVVEALNDRYYSPFKEFKAFPNDLQANDLDNKGARPMPPPPGKKSA